MELPHLTEQLDGASILPGGKRGYSTGDIDRHRLQELGELVRRSLVKSAISALSCARDLAKHPLDRSILALLKHECAHAQTSELDSRGYNRVGLLLEGIAHEYKRAHLEQLGF